MKRFLEGFQRELLLSEEDKCNGYWEVDNVHFPYPLTPLFASFMLPAITEGSKHALANLHATIAQFCAKLSDGRYYDEVILYQGDPKERQKQYTDSNKALLPLLKQRLQSYVDDELLLFYNRLDAYRQQSLTLLEARDIILDIFNYYLIIWQRHFELIFPLDGFEEMKDLYIQLTGEDNLVDYYQLLSGVMNKSLETDRELWKLAEYAKGSPLLMHCFTESKCENYVKRLSEFEAGREFLLQLQNVLEVYGFRSSNSHEFADETWIENPEYALRIIASYVQKEYDFDQQFARSVQQREEQANKVIANMPEGEKKERFVQLYEWALDCWSVGEDHHFYIDAMLPAKTRLFLLHVSEMLVEQGVFSNRNDIFYLYLDELLQVLIEPVSQLDKVEKRKYEHEENKKKQVRLFYGEPPKKPSSQNNETDDNTIKHSEEKMRTIKGIAASQGYYRGTVRVVHNVEDFTKIQGGDVLVCKTTTPPWTVLFSIVGAIVTDVGGILQHTATVAREYRVPCVVGTKAATSILKDGDVVSVDGTNGVIYLEQT